jgi:hypothetical protein
MHTYKVNLPKQNFLENDTFEDWVDRSYIKGAMGQKDYDLVDYDDEEDGNKLNYTSLEF